MRVSRNDTTRARHSKQHLRTDARDALQSRTSMPTMPPQQPLPQTQPQHHTERMDDEYGDQAKKGFWRSFFAAVTCGGCL